VRSERGEGAQNEKRMKPKLEQGPGTNKRVAARERERERGGRREEGGGRREKGGETARQAGREGGRKKGKARSVALRCVAVQLARASCGREATRERKEERAMGGRRSSADRRCQDFYFYFFSLL